MLRCQERGIAVHTAGVYCTGLLVGGSSERIDSRSMHALD